MILDSQFVTSFVEQKENTQTDYPCSRNKLHKLENIKNTKINKLNMIKIASHILMKEMITDETKPTTLSPSNQVTH